MPAGVLLLYTLDALGDQLVKLIATRRPIEGCDEPFLDWMSVRYSCWPKAARQGLIRWGIMVLKKKHVRAVVAELHKFTKKYSIPLDFGFCAQPNVGPAVIHF